MSTTTGHPETGVPTTATNHGADPTKTGALAQQIVAILLNEDSVTRHRAISAALMLLGEQPLRTMARGTPNGTDDDGADAQVDMARFFERDGKLKPSENAFLCSAYHYSLYGRAAFSLEELREIAKEAGVVIPDRVDMTLKQAG